MKQPCIPTHTMTAELLPVKNLCEPCPSPCTKAEWKFNKYFSKLQAIWVTHVNSEYSNQRSCKILYKCDSWIHLAIVFLTFHVKENFYHCHIIVLKNTVQIFSIFYSCSWFLLFQALQWQFKNFIILFLIYLFYYYYYYYSIFFLNNLHILKASVWQITCSQFGDLLGSFNLALKSNTFNGLFIFSFQTKTTKYFNSTTKHSVHFVVM